MISLSGVSHIITSVIPLYIAMIAAYISLKWWKLFTPDQCSGINKFVANFSIPLLTFQVISTNNPYKMNLKLVCADFLQKTLAFIILSVSARIMSRGNLKWIITGVSLSTLPNTLVLGIPLLRAMYGSGAVVYMAQIVVLQSLVWYNILLILFEFDATNETLRAATPTRLAGLFMASQRSLIACGTRKAISAMALKFVVGPLLMAAPSFALGMRGPLLKVAILQGDVWSADGCADSSGVLFPARQRSLGTKSGNTSVNASGNEVVKFEA
ncbi:Auxin efflux carrier family protein [Dorcoceras hygrometricum]|uniref:Auxin efflux carrier family protein n=1 Tax=Dorcoceras hygrometricum TaxID=472368 RepID=A0A2Z7CHE3_9LAMI|nr:Auxin efflux carrier family protein [Dorcoceras hygrometricum]